MDLLPVGGPFIGDRAVIAVCPSHDQASRPKMVAARISRITPRDAMIPILGEHGLLHPRLQPPPQTVRCLIVLF